MDIEIAGLSWCIVRAFSGEERHFLSFRPKERGRRAVAACGQMISVKMAFEGIAILAEFIFKNSTF